MNTLRNQNAHKAPASDTGTIYSRVFLEDLGQKFGFDPFGSDNAEAIELIGRRYRIAYRHEKEPDSAKEMRLEYLQLAKETERYLNFLRIAESREFGAEMQIIARVNWAAKSLQKKAGPPISPLSDLFELLDLLRETTAYGAKQFAPRKGRKRDFALEGLVRHTADFWTEKLGRRFRIDYHEGSGTTEAFQFVKTLLEPFADIPDTKIVTAMRAEIEMRGNLKTGPKRPKKPAGKGK